MTQKANTPRPSAAAANAANLEHCSRLLAELQRRVSKYSGIMNPSWGDVGTTDSLRKDLETLRDRTEFIKNL
jgi:hypothetical protein